MTRLRRRFHLFISLLQLMGLRWVVFRVLYNLQMRFGRLRSATAPYSWDARPLADWVRGGIPTSAEEYAAWRAHNGGRFIFEALPSPIALSSYPIDITEADDILKGKLQLFGGHVYEVGFPFDWLRDPTNGITIPADRHWTQIPDFGATDIKLIWEPSRFGAVFPLLRAYALTCNNQYAETFWTLIESWRVANPPQLGPHWKCGQETSLRLLAWCFGLYGFRNSTASTPERIAVLNAMIAAEAERVEANYRYAYFTKSNHGISEAFGLWLVGRLFPEFKAAKRWHQRGKALLEEEAKRQFYPDGSYLMHSLNYHRSSLHIYLLMMRLAQVNGESLSPVIPQAIRKSVQFFTQLIDLESGAIPATGSNDGTLILPLNCCAFNDFRPLIQLGEALTEHRRLLPTGPWDEDLLWFGLVDVPAPAATPIQNAVASFPDGGTFILRSSTSAAIMRAAHFIDRPSHSDQLHVDLWWRGLNIAVDAGTYRYYAPAPWENALAFAAVHNTVTVDHREPMPRVSRFTWTQWHQAHTADHRLKDGFGYWEGVQNFGKDVTHTRTVSQIDPESWLITDRLTVAAHSSHVFRLHWLLLDCLYEDSASDDKTFGLKLHTDCGDYHIKVTSTQPIQASLIRSDEHSARGWRSQYYDDKKPALSIVVETCATETVFHSLFSPNVKVQIALPPP